MNNSNILAWLRKQGMVTLVIGSEVHMKCPKCDHVQFYFNMSKGVGFCHRASCHWKPSLKALAEHWGSEPSDVGWTPVPQVVVEHKPLVALPKNVHPVIELNQTNYTTRMFDAYNWLNKRKLTPEQIYHWGILANYKRIYVPIYSKGNLVQYIARLYDVNDHGMKYKYAKGVSVTNFLFGWDEQDWTWMTLVENTFVSIWLRNEVNCTTNFGSHLSDAQVGLIARSKVKEVIFLWDGDAIYKAEVGIQKLRRHGINSKFINIIGQPDDYPVEFIREIVAIARLGSSRNINVRDVCRQLKGLSSTG